MLTMDDMPSDPFQQAPAPYFGYLHTRFGQLLLVGADDALVGLYLADHERAPVAEPGWVPDEGRLDGARRQLDEYFAGTRSEFDLAVRPQGTEFQREVWAALCGVPYGETVSYGELARRVGRPGASRAVGAANGSNPVSVVVPCHRVIGSDGRLTGYGWGVDRKEWLLDHEQGRSRLLP